MIFNEKILETNGFKFVPNKFTILESDNITENNFKKIKKN